ncbi:MAG TPA: glycosyltransferase family 9 protein [Fulvivirga sp.]|nr:glycosyltransferase family 9 protein [Fulvivirga sp.]
MKKPLSKILIIQTAFLGDVVLASALLEKLHQAHPDSELHFLLRKGNEAVFNGHPYIAKLWIFDKGQKLKNAFKIIKALRVERYDLVINLQRFAMSGIITALSGAKRKIGFSKNPLSFLFSQSYEHSISTDGKQHEVDRNQKLIADITDDVAAKPRLYPSVDDFKKVKEYKKAEYITIAPASVWFTKQWPKEKWLEFMDSLPSALMVYLLGAKGDQSLCEELKTKSKHKEIEVLAGQLSPLASAALMQEAKMNYVNDSAPMHFASSVNAPVTAVYCSTVPAFGFGPLSDQSIIIETTEKLDCRPCGLHGYKKCPEGHFKCAINIDPARLIK